LRLALEIFRDSIFTILVFTVKSLDLGLETPSFGLGLSISPFFRQMTNFWLIIKASRLVVDCVMGLSDIMHNAFF